MWFVCYYSIDFNFLQIPHLMYSKNDLLLILEKFFFLFKIIFQDTIKEIRSS